jgi:trans-2,3-dihydro-3-hydroxyanthranilate isomerase
MRRKYYTLDVFTETALTGNPLAVVLDCDGLDHARMQAIAREFNVSETVFVLEPHDPVNTARVRIFTPAKELPFAGHPTIGTAILLARLRAPELLAREDLRLVLEEKVGDVVCFARHRPGQGPRAHFTLPRLPESTGDAPDADTIAAALGLSVDEIGFGAHRPSAFSAGVPYIFVPVRDRAAIGKARLDAARWREEPRAAVYLYTPGAEKEGVASKAADFHARMFAPDLGIGEDPATGSAAAAFAGVVMRFLAPGDGDHTLTIEQGVEMGRPSLIVLSVDVDGGALTSASIGGAAVIVAEGAINV